MQKISKQTNINYFEKDRKAINKLLLMLLVVIIMKIISIL